MAAIVVHYAFHLPVYVSPVVLLWAVLGLAGDAGTGQASATAAQLASW